MEKFKWWIVKEMETGEYYPAIPDVHIQWKNASEGYINQDGKKVELIFDMGKVSTKQSELIWKAFRVGMEMRGKDIQSKENEELQKQVFDATKKKIFDSFKSGLSTYELGGWERDLVHVCCKGSLFKNGVAQFVTDESHFFYDMEKEGQIPAYEVISSNLANFVVEGKLQLEPEKISLKDFLSYFDFDYEIVQMDAFGEEAHREKLLEEGDLDKEMADKPLLRLIDTQGANLGGIEGDRFEIHDHLSFNIIERLSVYVNDYVISEFEEALQERNVDASCMSLKEMVKKANELHIGDGEVSYRLATYVLKPELIDVSPILQEAQKGIHKDGLDEMINEAKEKQGSNEKEKVFRKEIERG